MKTFGYKQKIDWDNIVDPSPTTAPADGMFLFGVNNGARDVKTYINGKVVNPTTGVEWSGNPMCVPVNKGDVISGAYNDLKFVPIYIYIQTLKLLARIMPRCVAVGV
jgi:hypothetical protein